MIRGWWSRIPIPRSTRHGRCGSCNFDVDWVPTEERYALVTLGDANELNIESGAALAVDAMVCPNCGHIRLFQA